MIIGVLRRKMIYSRLSPLLQFNIYRTNFSCLSPMPLDQNDPSKIISEDLRNYLKNLIKKRVVNEEDAEDLTQEVISRGWITIFSDPERLDLDTDEKIRSYFAMIAYNEINRFYKKKLNNLEIQVDEELLSLNQTSLISPENCLEKCQTICKNLPHKQRLAIFLKNEFLLHTLVTVISKRNVALMLEISETTLDKILLEIPLEEDQIKTTIEKIIAQQLRTSVRDERWKGLKKLKRIFNLN